MVKSRWTREQVHNTLLIGYCQNIISGVPVVMTEVMGADYFVSEGEEDGSPVNLFQKVNKDLGDIIHQPSEFLKRIKDATERREQQVLRCWRWAQQCAKNCHKSEAACLRYLRSLRQLHHGILGLACDRLGDDDISQDHLADEYERIALLVERADISATAADAMSKCSYGFNHYGCPSPASHPDVLRHHAEIEKSLPDGRTVASESFEIESTMTNFSYFGLQRGNGQSVLDVAPSEADVYSVIQYFNYMLEAQTYDYSRWYVHNQRFSKFLPSLLTPKSHTLWLEKKARKLADYQAQYQALSVEQLEQEGAEYRAEQIQMMMELVHLAREWLATRQDPDNRSFFSMNTKIVSVMGLVDQLETDMQQLSQVLEDKQAQVNISFLPSVEDTASQVDPNAEVQQNSAPSQKHTSSLVSSPRSLSSGKRYMPSAFSFASALVACVVVAMCARFIPHQPPMMAAVAGTFARFAMLGAVTIGAAWGVVHMGFLGASRRRRPSPPRSTAEEDDTADRVLTRRDT